MSSETQPLVAKQRYQLIDALRGLSIVLMVGYHAGIQIIQILGAPPSLIDNALLNTLQPIFAGVFILLSGMSCYFARSNVARGLKTWACAIAVSVVMYFAGYPVWFGILHFLGTAMLLYAALQKPLQLLLNRAQPWVYGAMFIASYCWLPIERQLPKWTLPLGLGYTGIQSWDFFPLLPWFFLFLLGTWLGRQVVYNRFPRWFYTFHMPVLPWIGRHTLIIYLAHQPVVLGILELLKALGVGR